MVGGGVVVGGGVLVVRGVEGSDLVGVLERVGLGVTTTRQVLLSATFLTSSRLS